MNDPSAWLRGLPAARGPAGLAAIVPPALDAVRSLLGAGGGPGTLEVTTGVAVTAANDGGTLRLAVAVDGSAFAGAGDADRLTLQARLGLAVAPSATAPRARSGRTSP